jgi:hypothetical protein
MKMKTFSPEKNTGNYLEAGYGEKKITPPLGTDLAGFGFYLDRRSTVVRDELKARALYLKNEENALLLVSLDLLGLTVELSDRIRKILSGELGLPPANILLACTHTHSGPAVQPLPGLGKVNPAYVRTLPPAILEACLKARASLEKATFGYHHEAIEPIGYNRRLNDFSEIDPWLRVGIFKLKKGAIFLLNYACHPVTLGPSKEISSDWPGAAVRALEKSGHRSMVLQGFCGDIDPVSYLNRRLGHTRKDYELYGQIIASRALKSEKHARYSSAVNLRAVEERIKLPLSVFPREDLEKEVASAEEANRQFPNAKRIVQLWRQKVEKVHQLFLESPWLENVPVQALDIGGMKLVGLPGEPFCSLGIKLRQKWPRLITAGYANGDVGYLPTRAAFTIPGDYACYCAPKFYGSFSFSPELEATLIEASHRLLKSL